MADLNIQEEFNEIRQRYQEDTRNDSFNLLLYGDYGTGKTYSLRNARLPVLIHSFDPGGTESLRDLIESGEVIADTTFEVEDADNPSAFRKWEREYKQLKRKGIFDHIGTYVIDSATMWADALMNQILKSNNRTGGKPQLQDYLVQIGTAKDAVVDATGLPCDFVLTGHIDTDKDEVSGRIRSTLMITGKLKTKLPLLFNEVWVSQADQTSKGVNYSYLTQADGLYHARSRIAATSDIKKNEDQNIRKILKKSGRDVSPMDLHLSEEEEESE